jgi:murein DD-endopeptidase MepM/ murein hydrolase activator NlpD
MELEEEFRSLIDYVNNIFEAKKRISTEITSKNKPISTKDIQFYGEYQAPVKVNWKSSGDYLPNVATDARHPKGHYGIDIRVPGGTPVYPIAPGVVTNVGTDPKGGNVVNIQHPNNVRTYYAHLGSISVYKGDQVDKNTIIGTVGDSGNAKGAVPHLHFQVWENGQLQNPGKYFPVSKYEPVRKSEIAWLPGEKEKAMRWSITKHLQNKRKVSNICPNGLLKLANKFYKLSINS